MLDVIFPDIFIFIFLWKYLILPAYDWIYNVSYMCMPA
jgi:hypothetical protein